MKIRSSFYLVLVFIACLFSSIASAQNPDLQLANEKYRQQDYAAASEAYEKIIADGYQSKALYYNLGNAYYRLNEAGKSVLNYERALLLAPKDKEIQENLAFVKSQLKDEIIALEVFPLIAFWQNVRNSLSVGAWTWLGLLLFWAGFAGLIIWILGTERKYRVKGFFLGISILAICSLPLLMAFGRKQQIQKPAKAVVVQDGLNLQATPTAGSETLYVLFEGATVNTLETLEGWEKVSLANGYQGWVQAEGLAHVK
jgi:tetratricopeptide (TPR) repeat protein